MRCICASAKPHDKAAVRLLTATPFLPGTGCTQNGCRMRLEYLQDGSGTREWCVPDVCKRYLGAELYCIKTMIIIIMQLYRN